MKSKKNNEMKTGIILFMLLLLFAACDQQKNNEEWEDLLVKQNFEDFEMLEGEGEWYFEDSILIGECLIGNPNSYLCTKKSYSDFVMELDFQVGNKINSGVQVRTTVHKNDTNITYVNGRLTPIIDKLFKKGSIYGYQIEMDPSERAWTGGLYQVGGRGWIVHLKDNPKAQQAYKNEGWNHMRIKCKGDSIATWINGVQAVSTTDKLFDFGAVGFQLHKINKQEQQGQKIKFKNVKIKTITD